MVVRLVNIHMELDELRAAALDARMPTAISMGLQWLRDDAFKVIADIDPDFVMPEED